MLESSFTQANLRLEEERRAKFCGTASISISLLKPTSRVTNRIRRPVPEPLKRLYREEHGCRQEDNRHHAKATISQDDFALALSNAGISAERLQSNALPYLRLEFPPEVQLECLQGTDRIMAADEVFDGTNKHLSDKLKTLFLFRHKKYLDAFDALLAIPALFCGFRLSVVHKVISMRCDEPNLHYLKHILNVWTDICRGDSQTIRLIDRQTIERLQGTAPGAFSTDYNKLLSYDQKFLSTAADYMRRLTGFGSKVTVLRRLDEMFQDTSQQADQCMVQVSQTAYVTVPGDTATRFDLGCRQLWLAAFWEFWELPADTLKSPSASSSARESQSSIGIPVLKNAYKK
ncbi:hypothetical protein LZ31DRAFT_570677 [Colletotrichum somersetense]|nr:hypothetical protein LZ31DRAFT_570677 [Colletotrichum somersetense]